MEDSYVSSLDDMPPHPLDSVTVISEDGEVLERPMDSGAHIEVEAVPKSDGVNLMRKPCIKVMTKLCFHQHLLK